MADRVATQVLEARSERVIIATRGEAALGALAQQLLTEVNHG